MLEIAYIKTLIIILLSQQGNASTTYFFSAERTDINNNQPPSGSTAGGGTFKVKLPKKIVSGTTKFTELSEDKIIITEAPDTDKYNDFYFKSPTPTPTPTSDDLKVQYVLVDGTAAECKVSPAPAPYYLECIYPPVEDLGSEVEINFSTGNSSSTQVVYDIDAGYCSDESKNKSEGNNQCLDVSNTDCGNTKGCEVRSYDSECVRSTTPSACTSSNGTWVKTGTCREESTELCSAVTTQGKCELAGTSERGEYCKWNAPSCERKNIDDCPHNRREYRPFSVNLDAPKIYNISGCTKSTSKETVTTNCPRQGGTKITINGMNFGEWGAVVLVDGKTCKNVQHISTRYNATNTSINGLCKDTCLRTAKNATDCTNDNRPKLSYGTRPTNECTFENNKCVQTTEFDCSTLETYSTCESKSGCGWFGSNTTDKCGTIPTPTPTPNLDIKRFAGKCSSSYTSRRACDTDATKTWSCANTAKHTTLECILPEMNLPGKDEYKNVQVIVEGAVSSAASLIKYQTCDAGQVQDSFHCSGCSPGKFSTLPDSTSCTTCTDMTEYAACTSSGVCNSCPTNSSRHSSLTSCTCNGGYFALDPDIIDQQGTCSDETKVTKVECITTGAGTCSETKYNNQRVQCLDSGTCYIGKCSNSSYTNKKICEKNTKTWTSDGYCSDETKTSENLCTTAKGTWTKFEDEGSCTDNKSTNKTDCEKEKNGTWNSTKSLCSDNTSKTENDCTKNKFTWTYKITTKPDCTAHDPTGSWAHTNTWTSKNTWVIRKSGTGTCSDPTHTSETSCIQSGECSDSGKVWKSSDGAKPTDIKALSKADCIKYSMTWTSKNVWNDGCKSTLKCYPLESKPGQIVLGVDVSFIFFNF